MLKLRKKSQPPRNPAKGYANLWMDVDGHLKFENDTGRTVAVDTPSFDFPETAPATSTATGIKGDVLVVADYLYVCTATDTWRRTALTVFPEE